MIQSWSGRYWKLGIASSLVTIGAFTAFGKCAFAQVMFDATLGAEHSRVTPPTPSTPMYKIDGGAQRGTNLFHSFKEFNVREGQAVYFINPGRVDNILVRVTGNYSSNIFGKLGVLGGGNANFFLINPHGITFGPNASLDVKGSFVATTANSIQFGTQGFFNASAPNVPSSLLTVNPSALLFNQIPAGSITNSSREPAGQLAETLSPDKQPMPLFGLKVPDGQSLLLVGGNVRLEGGGLNALGGRVELGGVAGLGTVGLDVNGKNIHLSFPNDLVRADISFTDGARVDASGEGGGSIQVQGRNVTLQKRSQIIANTLGSKPGGDLVLIASDSVDLIGYTPNGILSTQTSGTGNAGNLTISTRKLNVRDGAQVLTSTMGEGRGGNLTVSASESIELSGTAASPSGLFSSTTAAGQAGNLTINTRRLLIQGAALSTESSGVENPEQFIPATGRGGNLTVNASESVELIGTDSGLFANTSGGGAAGDLSVATGKLIVRDQAAVAANSEGKGAAGNLEVRAPFIGLDQGSLSSETTAGDRGNITLHAQDLQLRHNSNITTTASNNANGGNITINTQTLTALENSSIKADAAEGQGGNIQIRTQGLFLSPDSKITAMSERGPQYNGIVQINTLGIDPSRGLLTLPLGFVNIPGLIAQGCPASIGPRASKFVVTGRGGLPPTPREALRSEPTLVDLGTPIQGQANHASAAISSKPTSSEPTAIVEAQGWITNAKGEIVLVAQAPNVTTHQPWQTLPACH